MDQDKQEHARRAEFNQKKRELTTVRSTLSSLHNEKEMAYRALQENKQTLKPLLDKVEVLRKERDVFTEKVKDLKKERDSLNTIVKQKATSLKDVEAKKQEMTGKQRPRESPGKLKSQIDVLEKKLETEVMPFSQEKQLTKKLKELRAQYEEVKSVSNVWQDLRSASAEFSVQRKRAQEVHKQLQEKAKASQAKHKEMDPLYDQIKQLRAGEKQLVAQYVDLKKRYEEKKQEMEALRKEVNVLAREFDEQEVQGFKLKAKQKTAEVREKIKKGKKLSTEDILAFQATDD